MTTNRPRGAWTLLVLALATVVGCGESSPLILDNPASGMHYDTRYEEILNSEKSHALIEGAWRPYVETLDEPAAIIDWREGVSSTWEVFFATNRGLLSATAGTSQERFGNEVATSPNFGRAEIVLPRRRRGVEPRRESPGDQSTSATRESAGFEQVRNLAWDDVATGVNEQLGRSRQGDLLLFVHGFNVNFESCLVRTAQIALDMPFNGAVVCYSWPSQGGVRNYGVDEPINAASVKPFAEFLGKLVASVPPETRINIVAHSMGNRLVMQAIGKLPTADARKPLANVVLCAPDVGMADFRAWAPGVIERSEQVTLYASSGDAALVLSKGLHEERRAGSANPPLVMAGIETIDCSTIDFDFLGHSYYGSNVDVLTDLFELLKQRHKADQRPYLARRTASGGQSYWQYKAHAPRMLWTWNFDEKIVR